MKVIFLDHDGVICLSREWGTRFKKMHRAGVKRDMSTAPILVRFDNFNQKAIDTLNSILEETEAEIVVSSDWKNWATVEEMGEYYESQGIIRKPIDFTPNLVECNIPKNFVWNPNFDLEQCRHFEILQWLNNHPEVTEWVAIDDLDMSIREGIHSWGLTNFVLTPSSKLGINEPDKKQQILKFLL